MKTSNVVFNVRSILLASILILLVGCSSSTHTPAPVTSVKGYRADLKSSINSSHYTVKKGETLYAIAWRTNQDFKFLAALNNIKAPYQIYPGQVLKTRGKVPAQYANNKVAKTSSTSSTTSKSNVKAAKPAVKKPQKTYSKPKQAVVVKAPKPKPARKPTKAIPNKKRLSWSWPASGSVVKGYSNTSASQKGINIAGKRGSQVIAAEGGRVVYAGSGLRGYGNLIIIKHNDDYLSAYAYNQSLLVKEKQWVNAGQRIATMGNSGPTEQTALYFEIRYRGKPVNPRRYLPKR